MRFRRSSVACEGATCAGLDAHDGLVRLRGQVCNGDERLFCSFPTGVQTYLRSEARAGRSRRVLVVGARPEDNVWEAATGFVVAALMLLGLIGLLVALRPPRRAPRAFVEESVACATSRR